MKVAPRGFDGYFTASVFDLKRQHVATTDPVFTTLQNQTGEVTSRGIEIEAVANATRELKLIGSFTAYRLFNSRDLDPALVGKTPTADYTFKDGPLAGFGFGGGLRYIGSSWADTANTLEVPAVVLGDLALHYEWQNWRTRAERGQFDRQDLRRELRGGVILLLRRPPARHRQRLLQMVRQMTRTGEGRPS
ncbi:outer membrane receptor protein involved in Fe transport [Bradyrhizobium sp. GM6.1]